MCWLRAWGQILLPVFLCCFLIQLLTSFSENGIAQKSGQRSNTVATSVASECMTYENCTSCTSDKRCFWCSEEKSCEKFSFPFFDCGVSSIFWLNCRVDMFGFLMLILIILIIVSITWCCCATHYIIRQNAQFFSYQAPYNFEQGYYHDSVE